MSGAQFDTRRRALGLSIGEAALVCGPDGTAVSERTINRWITDTSPVPDDAFDALDDLEEQMEAEIDRVLAIAAERTSQSPLRILRYRSQDLLDDSPGTIGLPLGAHAMMVAWLDEALAAAGIETEIVWADMVD